MKAAPVGTPETRPRALQPGVGEAHPRHYQQDQDGRLKALPGPGRGAVNLGAPGSCPVAPRPRGLGAVRALLVSDTVLNPRESPHHFHAVVTTLEGGSQELICGDAEGLELWGSHSYPSSRPSRLPGDWAALPPRRRLGGHSKPAASVVDPSLLWPWCSGPRTANFTTTSTP